jgi:DNA-binding beta-propeller fold protein YncE
MTRLFALVAVWSVLDSAAWCQQEQDHQLPMEHMSGLLTLVQTIPLPHEGYMDHLAVDGRRQRVFVPQEDVDRLLVVDLKAGKVIREIGLPGAPRTPFYDPATDEIWVDAGLDVIALSGDTYDVKKTVHLPARQELSKPNVHGADKPKGHLGTDNAAYDPIRGMYYAAFRPQALANSGAHGSIEIVDTNAGKYLGGIEMPGVDPAGLALEPSGNILYVAMADVVNDQSHVEVVDIGKRSIIAEWPITGGPRAHAAGLDTAHHRLFVGSYVKGVHVNEPGKLVVMDTQTGRIIQALDSVGGVDAVQFDPATRRIYVVGTTGTVAIFKQLDPDHYTLLGKVPTGPIAKSGLWVPDLRQFFSAVPKHIVSTPPYSYDTMEVEAHLMVFDELRDK